ncbi:MAG: hypothetical protein RBS89_01420 [Candidatus Delongbacteria bacterium]|jgi:YVTN family beta-propeller protein|nr:hypothetical protein [Candidatus Delongbacteria bacterium]
MKRFLAAAAALAMMWGCTDYEGTTDPVDAFGSVCLINGLGDVGTMSVINDQCVIENDVMSLGKWPNHIFEQGGIIYVTNSGNNNVQMINASTLQNTGSVELSPLSNPMRAAVSNRKLYATNSYGTGVDVYDFDEDSLYTIPITGVPDSCKNGGTDVILSNGTKVFVGVRNVKYDEFWNAVYGPEYIVMIDAYGDSVYTAFEAGVNIAGMLINEENELHVLSTGNRDDIGGFVRVFDLTAINFNTYSTVSLGSQPGSFAINSEGMVYAAVSGFNLDWTGFGGIMKYNSIDNQVLNGADDMLYSSASSGILGICIDGYDRVYAPLFDENKLVILENDSVKTTLTTGNGPQGLVFVKEQ